MVGPEFSRRLGRNCLKRRWLEYVNENRAKYNDWLNHLDGEFEDQPKEIQDLLLATEKDPK